MAVNIRTSMIAIRDYLRTNFPDPLNVSGSRVWIHYGSPDFTRIGKTPAIWIERATNSPTIGYVGSNVEEQMIRTFIHIICTDGDQGEVSGTVYTSTEELMDKIEEIILNLLETGATSIDTTNIKQIDRTDAGGFTEPTERLYDTLMIYNVWLNLQ
jgi:hypothetical protein